MREVTKSQLWSYADLTNRPTVQEMRYLLPRWLEILGTGEIVKNIDIACDLWHLQASGYPEDWASDDVELVEDCFHAFLTAVFNAPEGSPYFAAWVTEMEYIEFALVAGVRPASVFELLITLPEITRERIILNHLKRTRGVLRFSQLQGAPAEALADWLISQDMVAIVEKHFWNTSDEARQWKLSELLYFLERERAGRALIKPLN